MSELSATVGSRDDRAFIERKLRNAWHKERRFQHIRGLCFLLIWAAALVVLDLMVDWLFLASYRVPGWARMLLLAVNVVTLAVVLHRYWLRHLRRFHPVRIALEFERKHPELKSLLVSYVQIDDRAGEQMQASPALVAALRRQAVTVTRPMDFKEVISYRLLGRLLAFSAAVLGLFGGLSVYKSEFFRTLLRRMMNPVAHLEYPTRTVIEQVSGDLTVPQGGAAAVTALCGGEVPDRGTLHVRADGADWEKVALLKTGDRSFSYRFGDVRQGFDYYVALGDDESSQYRVTVIPAPKVIQKKITLTFPPHTHRKAEEHDSYYVEAPEGTKVAWRLRCDRPLASAELRRNFEDANNVALRIEEGGLVVTGELTVWRSFDYQFRWKLAAHPFLFETAGAYTVNVIPDLPPEVEVLEPLEDEKATIRKRLMVTFRASDDFGLSEAALIYSVNEGPEQRWRIGPLDDAKDKTFSLDKKLAELVPTLSVDNTIGYYIEVADNREGPRGHNTARSRGRRVYIVEIEDYLRSILEEQLRWISEVEELRGEEKKASDQVGKIKGPDTEPASQPASRP